MMRSIAVRVCIVVTVLLSATTVSAQISDSLKAELKKRSDNAYHMGSSIYLAIDAVCDGYLRPGEKYTLKWKAETVWLNDKELPKRYAGKLKSFYKENYRRPNNDFYTSATVPAIDVILKDMSFALVYVDNVIGVSTGGNEQLSKAQTKRIMQDLAGMIAADSLVDTARYFALQFDVHGLVIDGKKTDNLTSAKYAKALKKNGIDVNKAGASIWYNNNYRKQWW